MLVVSTAAQRRTVEHGCCIAFAAGVRPGMSLAHGRALIRANRVLEIPHEPDRDAAALAALVRWCFRWSPVVRAEPPDGVLLDIAGCEHLFGGEQALAVRVRDQLATLRLTARVGVASTVGTAWAVARFGDRPIIGVAAGRERRAIAEFPIAALRAEPEACESLAEVGVSTIGQLLDLPRCALPSRYGEGLLRRIDQALGFIAEPVHGMVDQEPLWLALELSGGTTQWESVAEAVKRMLGELVVQLRGREAGACRLAARFKRLDASPAEITLEVTRPTRARSHLWSLLRPKLERLHLGNGIERIELHALRTAPIIHEQRGIAGIDDDRERQCSESELARMLEAMAARLGQDRVRKAERRPSHRPERAFVTMPALASSGLPAPVEAASPLISRPTVLFDPPERIKVVVLLPEGPLLRLWWRDVERTVAVCHGPERVGGEWWLARESSRDYFRVQISTGLWLWVFHEPLGDAWCVQGVWS